MRAMRVWGLFLFTITASYSYGAVNSKNSYCAQDSIDFQEAFSEPENLMGFSNPAGKFRTGLCWWHSRLQRSATYLTVFNNPNGQRPSQKELKKIISSIAKNKKVVEISGFKNWNSFSQAYEEEITSYLNKWLVKDTVKFNWLTKGLKGKAVVPASKMRKIMDDLYVRVMEKSQTTYQMLQIKGVVAHAWLVYKMEEYGDGYKLYVIDSNSPTQTSIYYYYNGRTNFSMSGMGEFTPYTQYTKNLKKYAKAHKSYCGSSTNFYLEQK